MPLIFDKLHDVYINLLNAKDAIGRRTVRSVSSAKKTLLLIRYASLNSFLLIDSWVESGGIYITHT